MCYLEENRKDSLFNGVDEIDKRFKYVKNKINEIKLKQRIHYRFPKHETIDQLENVFVVDLGTYNGQEFAEAYAAGLYNVNHLRDRWNRDLTPCEIMLEKENVIVFDGSNGNPVMNMLQFTSEKRRAMKESILIKTEMRWLPCIDFY